MENPIWTTEYQQSVPTDLERTGNDLNNGTTENGEDGECSKKSDKEDAKDFVENELQKDSGPIKITISEKAKQIIHSISEQIKPLSQVEKFLLFLKLPAEVTSAVDPFRQPLNPLGSRSEITRTISWIKTHLEEDPDISLPKQEVYNEYHNYCGRNSIKPLSQADFGKVMKQVYPRVRARRLGTRGNSRYCYSGLRRCAVLKSPVLPDLADKLMSTEAPFTQSSLASAAWLIVKEWAEKLLNQEFSTIQALAYFLILNHSIGTGSEAASKITSAGEASLKEEGSEKVPNKHRELQLQLQRKIQQKNEGKEKKKRTQSPKSEQKPNMKKSRSQSVPAQNITSNFSPTTSATTINGGANSSSMGGECGSSSTASSSTSTSPTQAKPICDKSLDFTQLPVLPDFNSFQKPAAEGVIGTTRQEPQLVLTNKISITRLAPSSVQSCTTNVPSSPIRKQPKYKTLRPRLQQCDIVSYNPPPLPTTQLPLPEVEDHRSQHIPDIARIKEKTSDEECDVPDFPLTRERLNSVSNVSKDAMDEYLGTNNSQHEEELSKYFSNSNATAATESEDTSKLSTLRQLLVQNIGDTKPSVPAIFNSKNVAFTSNCLNQMPVQTDLNFKPQLTPHGSLTNISTSIKRRVSFETPLSEDSVPASPNTRRKNFSFTPISPGPQSPSGMHSKCSSTSASPFVSPRNTPVSRNKLVTTSILKNEGKKSLKVKREIDLTVEIPNDSQFCNNLLPMSAPVSPMLSNKSVLQKLLNSTSKVAYNPSYSTLRSFPLQPDSSPEMTQFLNSNVESNLEGYRSRSVPLHNMIAPIQNVLSSSNDFSEIDPIPESDSENVKQLLKSLEPPNNDIMDEISSNNNVNLREFGFQLISNMDVNDFPQTQQEFGSQRMMRSQSMGGEVSIPSISSLPSRSVPSTPVPFIKPSKINYNNSRSYPSTPLNSSEAFTYNINVNGDCLLNGQPVLDNLDLNFEMNGNESVEQNLSHDKDFSIDDDFDMVENDNQLINPGLIETNFIGNIE
ncbi:unnamed protein product [Psylliodes chrysocephalus]|uniref:RFX-type winged-helix domain-containing protein n=1 Tax=Psylliodes chrysocephalus TaxID=3402493 RepID=A0A9P0CXY5_9CUCU|nr:unnamed protein product [Psylliodes chrysocephala]